VPIAIIIPIEKQTVKDKRKWSLNLEPREKTIIPKRNLPSEVFHS